MAFWNKKPTVESLGAMAGQNLDAKPETKKFDSSEAKQETLDFSEQGEGKKEWIDTYKENIASEAQVKAQATEGKMSKLFGGIAKRLEQAANSFQERAQQKEQARVNRAGEKAVKREESIANGRGNVDYNRVISMNLNSSESAQTKSGAIETVLAAADTKRDEFSSKLKSAGEKLKGLLSLNYDRMAQLNITPRNSEERQTLFETLQADTAAAIKEGEDAKVDLRRLSGRAAFGKFEAAPNDVQASDLMRLMKKFEAGGGGSLRVENIRIGGDAAEPDKQPKEYDAQELQVFKKAA